ncbi:MAG: hypothetical protein WCK86_19905, partial [Planctomycetia bacterium]
MKSGVRSLNAPTDNLLSNGACMLRTSLACTLKSWAAQLLPISPRHQEKHKAYRGRLLTMEFRTFPDQMIQVPCQIIRYAHKVIYRPAELDRSDACVLSTMRQPADPRKGRRHGNRSTKERQIKTSAAT